MDFFTQQDRARGTTKRLIGYFALGTLSITLAVYVVVSLALTQIDSAGRHRRLLAEAEPLIRWRVDVLGWTALGTLGLILAGSLWRRAELSSGGSGVATALGGRPILSNATDPDERKLLNVVEEMAIASGTPVPQVYLLERETGINAFAAGYTPSDAVIGVTRGCMRLLTREELQGVIGHEFSHILNGDMRLNVRLMAWIFGILGLAMVGRVLLRVRGKKTEIFPVIGLALMVIGWAGVFFGRLIQSAVSRQREFLADASAVEFTRNPEGLASALKKIGGLGAGSRLDTPQATEASHLFFSDALAASFMTPFATHPPLQERIRALDPQWDGQFPRVLPVETVEALPDEPRRATRLPPVAVGLPGSFIVGAPDTVLPRTGQPTPLTLEYAAGWREALPADVAEAAHEPFGACCVICALLLSRDPAVRELQLPRLAEVIGPPIAEQAEALQPLLAELPTNTRLPLVDLTLPALRELSPEQFAAFQTALKTLIEADQQIELFEYMLQKIVRRHLESHFGNVRRRAAQYYGLKGLLPECASVLKIVAHAGAANPEDAPRAFALGWQALEVAAAAPPLAPPADTDLVDFDRALDRLDLAALQLKKQILTATATAIAADGFIRDAEAELLRAIADTLDCPIPPFVRLA